MSFVTSTGIMMRRLALNLPKISHCNVTAPTIQRLQSNQALLKVPPSMPKQKPTQETFKVQELQTIQRQKQEVTDVITSIQTNLRALQLQSVSPKTAQVEKSIGYQVMNRNARPPKRANKGARPCSRVARRRKRKQWGNPRRRG